jgi:hypothetical protein
MMVNYRTILAGLIALAVALAPVASALAAGHVLAMAAMQDCHGQATDDPGCCDTKAKCPDTCGVTCCKLVGVISALSVFEEPAAEPVRVADHEKPPDWQLRPRPPPPRT